MSNKKRNKTGVLCSTASCASLKVDVRHHLPRNQSHQVGAEGLGDMGSRIMLGNNVSTIRLIVFVWEP